MANHQLTRLGIVVLFLVSCCAKTTAQPLEPETKVVSYNVQVNTWAQQKTVKLLAATSGLAETTHRFLLDPSDTNREMWQSAWLTAHQDWQVLAYLLPNERVVQFQIDAWPVSAGYIDTLPEYPTSGIVSDLSLELSETTLRDQHGFTDDSEVALGFHALEYFVFTRPIDDFMDGATNVDRRRQMIVLIAEILLADITAYSATVASRYPLSNRSLLRALRTRNEKTTEELKVLGRHSAFSGSSLKDAHHQLSTLHELLGTDVGINHLLIELDPKLTRTLNNTLADALALLGNGEPDEAQAERLLLLVSALTHQLEEFELLLAGSQG